MVLLFAFKHNINITHDSKSQSDSDKSDKIIDAADEYAEERTKWVPVSKGLTEVIKVEDCGENIDDYDIPIYKAILIPKNATNGDMMAAMFPQIEVETHEGITSVKGLSCDKGTLDPYVHFWGEWWNARFKT